ncbi:MAG: hypothetical protein OXH11_18185 [Candidatus Aminicenantes bacterium]|nr:hypothetical protein [Candidatus Aminicenantes bacterium]
MKRSVFAAIVLLAWAGTGNLSPGQDPAPQPSEKEILSRALERGLANAERRLVHHYSFRHLLIQEKLDKEARPTRIEKRLYQVMPIGNVRYERLLEKDGEPLSKKEREDERRKEARFRRRLARDGSRGKSNDNEVRFNRDLVDRYHFRVEGTEELHGREVYRLTFEPKSRKLPVRRRIDRALNNSHGSVWLDQESYEIVRVEFELIRPTRIWWGILGSISRVDGMLDRKEGRDGVWFPSYFRLYLKGRILFRSLHSRLESHWSDFVPVAERSE